MNWKKQGNVSVSNNGLFEITKGFIGFNLYIKTGAHSFKCVDDNIDTVDKA